MTNQPDPDSEAILSQVRRLNDALDQMIAHLAGAGPAPSADLIAEALAEPTRALGAAAKEA
ncbi:MAG: hypothetical protein ABUL73_00740 [Alphaproteobacteria bacterium]